MFLSRVSRSLSGCFQCGQSSLLFNTRSKFVNHARLKYRNHSRFIIRAYSSQTMGKKVAVILSGCGVYDGTELHEASACLVHLSRQNAEVSMFAPDIEQMHTINHCNGEETQDKRNVLIESARIARGEISDIATLDETKFDAVVFPGGFGAAKNLSTFAVKGEDCVVNPNVEKIIKAFTSSKKPVGLCCISPVLAAKVVPGCEVTIGSDPGVASKIEAMKSKHVEKPVTQAHIDQNNKIVTAPAFMCGDAKIHDIFDGIGDMITNVLKLA